MNPDPDLWCRSAELGDFDAIIRLLTLMHEEETEPSGAQRDALRVTFESILRDPKRMIVVSGGGDGVQGTADLLIVDNLSRGGRPWGIVENVVVAPDHRRQGIARRMMETLIARAKEANCYKIQLISNESRSAAHALYTGLGFVAPVRGFRRYLSR